MAENAEKHLHAGATIMEISIIPDVVMLPHMVHLYVIPLYQT